MESSFNLHSCCLLTFKTLLLAKFIVDENDSYFVFVSVQWNIQKSRGFGTILCPVRVVDVHNILYPSSLHHRGDKIPATNYLKKKSL